MGVRAAESVVDLLLGRGAQPDVVDVRGRIALMMAAELGHAEVVEMLRPVLCDEQGRWTGDYIRLRFAARRQ